MVNVEKCKLIKLISATWFLFYFLQIGSGNKYKTTTV